MYMIRDEMKGNDKEMNKDFNENYKEVISKIETYDGLYYTLNIHSKEEILEIKKEREEISDISFTEKDIIDELIREDICNIITSSDDLIYLPYETKILNKKEIKQSMFQIR